MTTLCVITGVKIATTIFMLNVMTKKLDKMASRQEEKIKSEWK